MMHCSAKYTTEVDISPVSELVTTLVIHIGDVKGPIRGFVSDTSSRANMDTFQNITITQDSERDKFFNLVVCIL
jgi:hypothetical protein